MHVYERDVFHANEYSEWLKKSNELPSVGAVTAVELNPQDTADYLNKIVPLFISFWVIFAKTLMAKTYRET